MKSKVLNNKKEIFLGTFLKKPPNTKTPIMQQSINIYVSIYLQMRKASTNTRQFPTTSMVIFNIIIFSYCFQVKPKEFYETGFIKKTLFYNKILNQKT